MAQDQQNNPTDANQTANPSDAGEFDQGNQSVSDILNQDEIDSLLNNGGDSDNQAGVRALLNTATVSYERLPMLEIVFDRLVRLMSTTLRNFTQFNIEITLEGIDTMRFGDYLDAVAQPSMMSVFKAEEWDNSGLMTIDSSLIYTIVDVLLGGRRGTAAMRLDGRPYTVIERNLIVKMVHLVLSDLSAAFDPLSPVTFRFDRLETNPKFAMISRPSNAAVLAKFRIDMEDRGGRIELLLPYAMLEPVRELLLQGFMGEKFGRDSIWENHLAEALWVSEVNLLAVLDRQMTSLKNVLQWKVGTKLLLNATPDSDVEMICGDIPMFYGRMGRKSEHIAIQIEDKIKRQKD
ncbi:MAG: flagellar motor switch protein FliM [Alphaproteobacteria bacterium]|nr:flagellar motor switch protein FliM [Alphaproteobacteria bacterium]MBO4644364.1 flagellar motor switch protein FliM [Alphaproteobacteria bacterium]